MASPSSAKVVSTWQPATTVRAAIFSPLLVSTPVTLPAESVRICAAPSPRRRVPPSARNRLASAWVEHAAAADGVARRHPVHHRVPADQVRGRDLVAGRPGLRPHPGQRRLEPLVVEVGVEQGVAGGEELPGHLDAVEAGALADLPQRAAQPPAGGRTLEGLEDGGVAAAPVEGEGAVGLGVLAPADLLDAGAGGVEVDVERDRLLAVARALGPSLNGAKPHGSRSW